MPIFSGGGGAGSSGGMATLFDTGVIANAPATIDVNPIAGTYINLKVIASWRGTTAAVTIDVAMTINADAGANYDREQLAASVAAVTAAENFAQSNVLIPNAPAASDGAGLFSGCELIIFDYAGTTPNKVINFWHGRKIGTASGNVQSIINTNFWRSSAAVARLTFTPSSGNFANGSRLIVYGF